MIGKLFSHIGGGAAAGGFMGGIGGLMAGDEGSVGKGAFAGAIVGGVAGSGVASLSTRGGVLNKAAMSAGGMVDDLMGNTSSAGYFRAVDSNAELMPGLKKAQSTLDDAQGAYNSSVRRSMEGVTSDALSGQDKRATVDYLTNEKGMDPANFRIDESAPGGGVSDSDLLRMVTSKEAGYSDEVLKDPMHGNLNKFIQEMQTQRTGAKEAFVKGDVAKGYGKAVQEAETELSTYSAKHGTTIEANNKLIEAGPSSGGSFSDFFEGLGDSSRAAENNLVAYQKLQKSAKDGSIDDADYARMMNMEADFGEKLSASLHDGTLNRTTNKAYQKYQKSIKKNVAATNKALTYSGAGLTGVMVGSSMSRGKSHKRGMNSKRGARF